MSQVSAFGGRITIDKPDFYFSPTESYGVLGWVETAIMIVAGIIGVIALFWKTPESNKLKEVLVKSRLGCVVVLGAIMLWYLALPVFRFFEGELFALIFSIYVIVTHAFMLFASIFSPDPGQWIFTYALLMILACLVKIIFIFLRKDFEQRMLPRPALYAITFVLLAVYVILLILQIVSWRTSYDGFRPG